MILRYYQRDIAAQYVFLFEAYLQGKHHKSNDD